MILGIVISAYLGWIALCLSTVFLPGLKPSGEQGGAWHPYLLAATILITLWSYFATQDSPVEYYAYALFPCYFLAEVWALCSGRLAWQLDLRFMDILKVLGAIVATQTLVVRHIHQPRVNPSLTSPHSPRTHTGLC